MGHGKYSGLGIWVRALIHRIEKMKAAIDLLTFVKEDLKRSAITKYDDYFHSNEISLFSVLCEGSWESSVLISRFVSACLDAIGILETMFGLACFFTSGGDTNLMSSWVSSLVGGLFAMGINCWDDDCGVMWVI